MDRFVLDTGASKCFAAPWIPFDGIVCVQPKVRTRLAAEMVNVPGRTVPVHMPGLRHARASGLLASILYTLIRLFLPRISCPAPHLPQSTQSMPTRACCA